MSTLAPSVADVDLAVRASATRDGVCRLMLETTLALQVGEPGQFVLAKASGPAAPLLPRPLSIVGGQDGLELVFNVIGPGTRALSALQTGDLAQIVGPLGAPFPSRETPDLTMLVDAWHAGAILALVRWRSAAQLFSPLLYVVSEGEAARDAHLMGEFQAAGASLKRVEPGAERKALAGVRQLAAAASDPIMARVQRAGEDFGIAGLASLHAPMACGLGVCQACVRELHDGALALVCEGPHFALSDPRFDERAAQHG